MIHSMDKYFFFFKYNVIYKNQKFIIPEKKEDQIKCQVTLKV